MAQIKVDGTLVEVPDYYTLMQAAEAAGAEIRASATTTVFRSRATAACVSSK